MQLYRAKFSAVVNWRSPLTIMDPKKSISSENRLKLYLLCLTRKVLRLLAAAGRKDGKR